MSTASESSHPKSSCPWSIKPMPRKALRGIIFPGTPIVLMGPENVRFRGFLISKESTKRNKKRLIDLNGRERMLLFSIAYLVYKIVLKLKRMGECEGRGEIRSEICVSVAC